MVNMGNGFLIDFLRTAKPKQIEYIFNEVIGLPLYLVKLWDEIGDTTGKDIIIPAKNNEVLSWDDQIIVLNK